MQLTPRARAHVVGATVTVLVALAAHGAADDKWRLAFDTLVYADNDNVTVVTPQMAVHYRLDDDGGELRARVGVDGITAASVDIVAQGSRRGFTEGRTEVSLGASKAFGAWVPALDYRLSYEGDYFSNGLHAGLRTRIDSPDTVLQVGYGLTYDLVGKTGTLFTYNDGLVAHRADVSLTQNVDRLTVLRLVATLTVHAGYQAKPYRFVPVFDAGTLAAANAAGVQLGLWNYADYDPNRVAENVPYERTGFAIAGRVLRYVDLLHGSLKLDLQLYADDWGVVGTTGEPAIAWGPTPEWLLTVYGRFYAQWGARFWQRTYSAANLADLSTYPVYVSMDRYLSQMQTVGGGLRVEWMDLGKAFGLYGDVSVTYMHYDQFLYLDGMTYLVVQGGVRWSP